MTSYALLLYLFVSLFSLTTPCADASSHAAPIKVIFDTDIGSDCDDAGALALLHNYADRGLAEIIGCVYSSGKVPYGAAVVEAINVYYGRPGIPVGASHDDIVGDPVDKMQAEKLARDRTAYGHSIVHNHDAPEMTLLNRRLLAVQPDQSVTYITVGHTKGLHDLLVSSPDEISSLSGEELIRKKISRWVALGALSAMNPQNQFAKDWNFFHNGTAPYTSELIKRFPVPAYFIDAGSDVMTGRALKQTQPGNIVRDAYRDWLWNYSQRTLDDQRPSWDLAAVYFSVEGTGEYLRDIGPGHLKFDVEKGSLWVAGENNMRRHYIKQKDNISFLFSSYLNQCIATAPKFRPDPDRLRNESSEKKSDYVGNH